jgi:hypothetical protein
MRQSFRTILHFTAMFLLACIPVCAQRRGAAPAYHSVPAYNFSYGNWGGGPIFGGAGLYASPINGAPRDWWAGPYANQNPCPGGCNPNAGYDWESVGALVLNTNPPTARVTLDGIYAGTTDRLGPFQLPVGEHTLHVEAAGFQPSDIVVKFDEPGVQSLSVDLKHLTSLPAPAQQR